MKEENDDRIFRKFRKWEVLKRWGIDGNKLTEYVCDGLHAYDHDGKLLPTIEDYAHALAFRYNEEEFLTYLVDRIAWFIIDDVIDYEVVHGIAQHDTAPIPAAPAPSSDAAPETPEMQESPVGRVNERLAIALEFAKMVKKNYPELTRKEAAKQINLWMAKEYKAKSNIARGYSLKHLMRLIKKEFKPGKPGNPGGKPQK